MVRHVTDAAQNFIRRKILDCFSGETKFITLTKDTYHSDSLQMYKCMYVHVERDNPLQN